MPRLKHELPVLTFATHRAWEQWLAQHHAASTGVRIKFAKKGSGLASVTYAEALEVALCYGWIDSQVSSLDDSFYLQRFTPRSARSKWSKINRERATALIDAGKMAPAGLAEIAKAKNDGRWEAAYDSPRSATVPDDFRAALDREPEAGLFFATLKSVNRYAILHRLQTAKRPQTRDRLITKFIAMLKKKETLYQGYSLAPRFFQSA